MNAEFNWWLLIVGLVVGAGLVWLVVLESRRREADLDDAERARESAWLSAVLAEDGHDISPGTAGRVLELHRRYLEAPPPDPVAVDDHGLAATGVRDGGTAGDVGPAAPEDGVPGAPSELADDDRVRVEGGRVDPGQ